jgi:hypothetical protein
MQELQMKKIVFFLLTAFICSCFLPNCKSGPKYTIRFDNETGNEITLISVSERIKNETPIVVQPHTRAVLYSDTITSGTDIVFSYNGKKYSVNTGYADDYRGYTLQISESVTSAYGIDCIFIVRGFTTEESSREITVFPPEPHQE